MRNEAFWLPVTEF